jgi:predicted Fe-Mo cluster-binding NifX family protein
MRIAIACDEGKVTGHFGHCATFEIFETDEEGIVSSASVANPGHKPGFLPNYLKDQGVGVIIADGMGQHAIALFEANGIEVFLGASGTPEEIVGRYLAGTLESLGSGCTDHEHHEGCGNH